MGNRRIMKSLKTVDFSDNSDTDTLETTKTQLADLGNTNAFTNQLRAVPDDNVINKNIRSLNMQQSNIFNFVHNWLRGFFKSLGFKSHQNVKPFIYLSRLEQGLGSFI